MRDYFKPIIIGAGGVILLIMGISFLNIPGTMQVFGIIFIVAAVALLITTIRELWSSRGSGSSSSSNKPSPGHPIKYGHPQPPSSSNDDEDENYWNSEFESELNSVPNYHCNIYVNVCIPVINVDIQPSVWTGGGPEADARAENDAYDKAYDRIVDAYNKVAKKCPYSTKLHIRRT